MLDEVPVEKGSLSFASSLKEYRASSAAIYKYLGLSLEYVLPEAVEISPIPEDNVVPVVLRGDSVDDPDELLKLCCC